jgi:two-component system response regulator YesN
LSAIANEMYFSPNYINTLFKEETGDTIPEYKTKVRINKAKEYLKDPSLKLYEIVEKVGYKHTPYFNALFKKYTGMTPNEYRRLGIVE